MRSMSKLFPEGFTSSPEMREMVAARNRRALHHSSPDGGIRIGDMMHEHFLQGPEGARRAASLIGANVNAEGAQGINWQESEAFQEGMARLKAMMDNPRRTW